MVHHLVRLAADHFIDVIGHWVSIFGPERLIPYAGAPTESNQIISPKVFEEFVFPYQKEVHEKILAIHNLITV